MPVSWGCSRILRKGENAGKKCGKPRMRWGVGRNSHICNWCWHCNQTRRLNKCRDGGSNRRVKCVVKVVVPPVVVGEVNVVAPVVDVDVIVCVDSGVVVPPVVVGEVNVVAPVVV